MRMRLDVAKILSIVNKPSFDQALRKLAIERVGFSGPEFLLASLRGAFRFDSEETETLDGKAVWVLHGEWQDFTAFARPDRTPIGQSMHLPSYLPSRATVWLGQDDGWPYKVMLVGERSITEDDRPEGPDGKPIGAKSTATRVMVSKVVLSYSNVALNPQLDGGLFAAPPAAVGPLADATGIFLDWLKQMASAGRADMGGADANETGEGRRTPPTAPPDTEPSSPAHGPPAPLDSRTPLPRT
jgi:hypothetical protein